MVSGFEKLMQPYQNFLYVLESYEIFPEEWAAPLSRSVPWFELIGGVFLFLGLHLHQALAALWAFNAGLLLTVAQAVMRGLDITECGCFGSLVSLTLNQVIVMDIILCLLFFVLWSFRKRALTLSVDARMAK